MPRAAFVALMLAVAMATGSTLEAQTISGAAIYDKYCAQCHNQVTARIPTRDALQKMSPARIMRTRFGGMPGNVLLAFGR